MNVRLLRKVAKHIQEEPRRLDMNRLLSTAEGLPSEERPPCGTVGCICGWAYGVSVKRPKKVYDPRWLFKRGRKLLQLSQEQAERLFAEPIKATLYGHCWPEKFNQEYLDANSAKERARITVARIEHFIKTKGKE